MKNVFWLVFLFLVSKNLIAKEVAFTIDDAPMRDMAIYSGDQRASILIGTFKKHNIQVVFFSISRNLSYPERANRMQRYVDAGHLIANHTHSHPNYDQTSISEYLLDVDRAHELLRSYKTFRPWFRFPMLRHGNTVRKRDSMRKHLSQMKYRIAYVSLDIQDWFMASLVDQGVKSGRDVNTENLCSAYSDLISDTMENYNSKAVELLGRSPKHAIVLHENDLLALCLETLISKIQSQGWKIISPEEAYKDPIYQRSPNTLFNNNGLIAALYHEAKNEKIYDPWSYPWNDGQLIRDEFQRRKVFKSR